MKLPEAIDILKELLKNARIDGLTVGEEEALKMAIDILDRLEDNLPRKESA